MQQGRRIVSSGSRFSEWNEEYSNTEEKFSAGVYRPHFEALRT
jgi:hypothetical protein